MSRFPVRRTIALCGAALLLSQPVSASPLFEGDTRLACEAILCLSSGSRPSECTPSLQRYFGIRHKKPQDTVRARHDFLRQCPSANHDDRMRSLVAAMANAAGSCQAGALNAMLAERKEITVCQPQPASGLFQTRPLAEREPSCTTRPITAIGNTLPAYCRAYFRHAYIEPGDLRPPRYLGEPEKGGHWID